MPILEVYSHPGMVVTLVSLFICLLATLPSVQTYSSGAPMNACSSKYTGIKPYHGYNSIVKSKFPPYEVTTNVTEYVPGQTIKVSIIQKKAYNDFKGFALKAYTVPISLNSFGEFIISSENLMLFDTKCNKNVVTHTNRVKKEKVEVEFKIPNDFTGDFEFRATVVKRYSVIYYAIKSKTLKLAKPKVETTNNSSNNQSQCSAEKLYPLGTGFPQIGILCNYTASSSNNTSGNGGFSSNVVDEEVESQCPCGWLCCPMCSPDSSGEDNCTGHAICRRSLVNNINATVT